MTDSVSTGTVSTDNVSTGTVSTDSGSNGNMLENHEVYSEPVKVYVFETAKKKSFQILEAADSELLEIRNHLESLRFGWMKFSKQKSAKFIPGFAFPRDPDGEIRAQWVVEKGPYFISSSTKICFEFHETINETLKEKRETIALNKFNKKFNFCYV